MAQIAASTAAVAATRRYSPASNGEHGDRHRDQSPRVGTHCGRTGHHHAERRRQQPPGRHDGRLARSGTRLIA